MNGGKPLKQSLRDKLDQYFRYRWDFDRNICLDDPNDTKIDEAKMMSKLPSEV
jgi:hypothetical protein